MKLSDLIAGKRREAGLTQQDLADQLFVSVKSVSKWETGNGNPSIELLPSISKILNISSEEMLSSLNDQNDFQFIEKETSRIKKTDWELFVAKHGLKIHNYSLVTYIILALFGLFYFILCSLNIISEIQMPFTISVNAYYYMGHALNSGVVTAFVLIITCVLSVFYWLYIPLSTIIKKAKILNGVNLSMTIINWVITLTLIIAGLAGQNSITTYEVGYFLIVVLLLAFSVYLTIISVKNYKKSKRELEN